MCQFSTGSIHGLTAVNVVDNDLDINTGKYHDYPGMAVCLIDCNALFRFYQKDGNWSERSACAALGCWHKRRWPL